MSIKDSIMESAKEVESELIEWRRQIHSEPELELDCTNTGKLIQEKLEEMDIEVKNGLAKTGVIGIIRGSKAGPVVALRVDMDALPMQEMTNLPFSSKNPGKMHACGHDGHTAIGLGVAKVLSKHKEQLKGTVKIIFQPGEEYPGGARIMIREGALENPRVDAVVSGHIFPGLPLGKYGVRHGIMTASNDEFIIELKGKSGHGARPHEATDAVLAMGNLIVLMQGIISRNIDPVDSAVVTIGSAISGSGFNVIAGTAVLKGTIRSISGESKAYVQKRIEEILKGMKCAKMIEEFELEILPGEPPLECDENLTDLAQQVLMNVAGKENVVKIESVSMGAEDFAWFSKEVPATYIRIGAYDEKNGYTNMLHSSHFDFNEKLLAQGVNVFVNLIFEFLESEDLNQNIKGGE